MMEQIGRPVSSTFHTAELRRILCVVMLGGFILFLTAYFLSAVWVDEMCYVDPAANLAHGQGFVSSVWTGQSDHSFFASNTPLHAWLLAGGFKIFGFSRLVVQGMNIALLVLACVLATVALGRLELVTTEWGRLSFLVMVLISSACFQAAGFGRYDPVGMVTIAGAVFAASFEKRLWRLLGLALCGFATVWAGLHVACYLAVLSVLVSMLSRFKTWREVFALAVGLVLGFVALKGLYIREGVLDVFTREVAGKGRTLFQITPFWTWDVNGWGGIVDPGVMLLIVASLTLGLSAARRSIFSRQAVRTGWALLFIVGVWIMMMWVGRFPVYYAWMLLVPGAACIVSAAESHSNPKTGRRLLAVLTTLMVLWLPFWIVLGIRIHDERDLGAVERLVEHAVKPGETVICDSSSYYAIYPRAARLYSTGYVIAGLLSDQEKETVTVIVARPAWGQAVIPILGGRWERMPESLGLGNDTPLPLNCWKYQLEVWRRRDNSERDIVQRN